MNPLSGMSGSNTLYLRARFYPRSNWAIGATFPYFCEPWICRRILDMHLKCPVDAHHPAVTGLAFDRRGAALPRPGQGTHQRPVHPPLPLALPDAPPARGVAPQGDLQRIAARHDRLQRAPL